MVDWLVGRLVGWLGGWFVEWLVVRMVAMMFTPKFRTMPVPSSLHGVCLEHEGSDVHARYRVLFFTSDRRVGQGYLVSTRILQVCQVCAP